MSAPLSPLAGKHAPASLLVDVPRLITAYYSEGPNNHSCAACCHQTLLWNDIKGVGWYKHL